MPREDPRHQWTVASSAPRWRRGGLQRLSGSELQALTVRKALPCHLAPPPKVMQLISIMECASNPTAVPILRP